jgi:lysozyme
MKVSQSGIDMLKSFEGFRADPYNDAAGIPTVGYGHVILTGEKFEHPLTEAEATDILCGDLAKAESCVLKEVDVTLTQSQFDALCSFVFNLGCGSLIRSTLLQKLNNGDAAGAADEFLRWVKVNGRPAVGLFKRRVAERETFIDTA